MKELSRRPEDWHRELATEAALSWARARSHAHGGADDPQKFGTDVSRIYLAVMAGIYGLSEAPAADAQQAARAGAAGGDGCAAPDHEQRSAHRPASPASEGLPCPTCATDAPGEPM